MYRECLTELKSALAEKKKAMEVSKLAFITEDADLLRTRNSNLMTSFQTRKLDGSVSNQHH